MIAVVSFVDTKTTRSGSSRQNGGLDVQTPPSVGDLNYFTRNGKNGWVNDWFVSTWVNNAWTPLSVCDSSLSTHQRIVMAIRLSPLTVPGNWSGLVTSCCKWGVSIQSGFHQE